MTDSEKLKIAVEALEGVHCLSIGAFDMCKTKFNEMVTRESFKIVSKALSKLNQPQTVAEKRKAREFWVTEVNGEMFFSKNIKSTKNGFLVREVLKEGEE